MKKSVSHGPFLEELKKTIQSLKNMKPGEVHVLSINANYGHYQIIIGPEQEGVRRSKSAHSRPIEINGEIHHVFVSPHAIRVHPSKRQMIDNLKDTVIMRDIKIHIVDPMGDGKHMNAAKQEIDEVNARECINLAGARGEKLQKETEHSRKLAMAAYKIAQEDILKSLKNEREESTQ